MKRAGRAADARNCWAKVVHVPAGRWPHRRLDGPGPGPVDGDDLKGLPYGERRQILEELRLDGAQWRVPEAFEDGEALWAAVCEHELEGLVAKRLHEPYLCGERAWVKVKNRAYWRYELEREGAFRTRLRKRTTRRVPRGC